jgi:endonuclease V-like protein UPF0215 family
VKLERLLALEKQIRVIGFDDSPFQRKRGSQVGVSGIVCRRTTFEGMVWGHIRQDGWNSTDVLLKMLVGKKFLPQLHVVLLDGIAFGGLNVVDLPRLSRELGLPCVTVMRRPPHWEKLEVAVRKLPKPEKRIALMKAAGPIYEEETFCFQVQGEEPEVIAALLPELTSSGHVPECLRLAHLIGSAIVTGESSQRA